MYLTEPAEQVAAKYAPSLFSLDEGRIPKDNLDAWKITASRMMLNNWDRPIIEELMTVLETGGSFVNPVQAVNDMRDEHGPYLQNGHHRMVAALLKETDITYQLSTVDYNEKWPVLSLYVVTRITLNTEVSDLRYMEIHSAFDTIRNPWVVCAGGYGRGNYMEIAWEEVEYELDDIQRAVTVRAAEFPEIESCTTEYVVDTLLW